MKKCVVALGLALAVSAMAGEIVINEIQYNGSGTDLEFVELFNASGSDVDVQGWFLLDDNDAHAPCRLTGTLRAGDYRVVASSAAAFRAAYPAVTAVNPNEFGAGSGGWSLSNGGETVRLFTAARALHDAVAYGDGGEWPGSPDGKGPTLELMNSAFDNALPSSWRASASNGGTPGRANSVYTANAAPVCRDGRRLTDWPGRADAVTVTVVAFDIEGLARGQLMVHAGAGYAPVAMNDGGTGGDAAPGDSVFTAVIPAQPSGTLVRYYAVATDAAGQQDTWPKGAPGEYHAYTVDHRPPRLRITELMAANSRTVYDASGDYDDWFEIHNEDAAPVDVGGLFVSGSFGTPRKFRLPSRVLAPGDFLLVWADDETEQGPLHANFKLSAEGEEIALFETVDRGNAMIHGWKFGRMGTDISMGFKPAGATNPEYLAVPTPDAPNETSRVYSPVCINEFQSTSDFGGPDDWVELYNRGDAPFDLSGCFLSDQRGDNTKWTFPGGAVLDPGEYLVVYEDVLNFGFSSEGGDVIMLTAADSTTGLDFYDFGPQIADHSEGRSPDGSSTWARFGTPTKGGANRTSAVEERGPAEFPGEAALFPAYPNPFNSGTVVSFSLPSRQRLSVKVYNARGQETAVLAEGVFEKGRHELAWRAADAPSGVYFIELSGGDYRKTVKTLLLR